MPCSPTNVSTDVRRDDQKQLPALGTILGMANHVRQRLGGRRAKRLHHKKDQRHAQWNLVDSSQSQVSSTSQKIRIQARSGEWNARHNREFPSWT